jgi:hypothetical protein
MAEPDQMRPEPGADADVDDIETDIEQTRKELGQTVEALSSKLDVKERARDKVADTKERVVEKAETVRHAALDDGRAKRTVPVATLVVLGALVAGILVWRRRR